MNFFFFFFNISWTIFLTEPRSDPEVKLLERPHLRSLVTVWIAFDLWGSMIFSFFLIFVFNSFLCPLWLSNFWLHISFLPFCHVHTCVEVFLLLLLSKFSYFPQILTLCHISVCFLFVTASSFVCFCCCLFPASALATTVTLFSKCNYEL